MALKESEAIVLRAYPLRESDLLVTLFTRMEGKVKSVARTAMKSRTDILSGFAVSAMNSTSKSMTEPQGNWIADTHCDRHVELHRRGPCCPRARLASP